MLKNGMSVSDAVEQVEKSLGSLSMIVNQPKLFVNDYFSELKFQIDVDVEEFLVGLLEFQDSSEAGHTSQLESCLVNRRRDIMFKELDEQERVLQSKLSSDQVSAELGHFKCNYEELKGQAGEMTGRESFNRLVELNERILYEINQATRLLLNDQSFVFVGRETMNNFENCFPNAKPSANRWPFQGVLLNFKKLILEKENFV